MENFIFCALLVKQSLELMIQKQSPRFVSQNSVYQKCCKFTTQLYDSTRFHINFTENHFCMSASQKNRYVFAKLLPIKPPGRLLLMIKYMSSFIINLRNEDSRIRHKSLLSDLCPTTKQKSQVNSKKKKIFYDYSISI